MAEHHDLLQGDCDGVQGPCPFTEAGCPETKVLFELTHRQTHGLAKRRTTIKKIIILSLNFTKARYI